jgi:hypothetical protein
MKNDPKFVLHFDPSEIDALAERYGSAQDDNALHAGKRIASGDLRPIPMAAFEVTTEALV